MSTPTPPPREGTASEEKEKRDPEKVNASGMALLDQLLQAGRKAQGRHSIYQRPGTARHFLHNQYSHLQDVVEEAANRKKRRREEEEAPRRRLLPPASKPPPRCHQCQRAAPSSNIGAGFIVVAFDLHNCAILLLPLHPNDRRPAVVKVQFGDAEVTARRCDCSCEVLCNNANALPALREYARLARALVAAAALPAGEAAAMAELLAALRRCPASAAAILARALLRDRDRDPLQLDSLECRAAEGFRGDKRGGRVGAGGVASGGGDGRNGGSGGSSGIGGGSGDGSSACSDELGATEDSTWPGPWSNGPIEAGAVGWGLMADMVLERLEGGRASGRLECYSVAARDLPASCSDRHGSGNTSASGDSDSAPAAILVRLGLAKVENDRRGQSIVPTEQVLDCITVIDGLCLPSRPSLWRIVACCSGLRQIGAASERVGLRIGRPVSVPLPSALLADLVLRVANWKVRMASALGTGGDWGMSDPRWPDASGVPFHEMVAGRQNVVLRGEKLRLSWTGPMAGLLWYLGRRFASVPSSGSCGGGGFGSNGSGSSGGHGGDRGSSLIAGVPREAMRDPAVIVAVARARDVALCILETAQAIRRSRGVEYDGLDIALLRLLVRTDSKAVRRPATAAALAAAAAPAACGTGTAAAAAAAAVTAAAGAGHSAKPAGEGGAAETAAAPAGDGAGIEVVAGTATVAAARSGLGDGDGSQLVRQGLPRAIRIVMARDLGRTFNRLSINLKDLYRKDECRSVLEQACENPDVSGGYLFELRNRRSSLLQQCGGDSQETPPRDCGGSGAGAGSTGVATARTGLTPSNALGGRRPTLTNVTIRTPFRLQQHTKRRAVTEQPPTEIEDRAGGDAAATGNDDDGGDAVAGEAAAAAEAVVTTTAAASAAAAAGNAAVVGVAAKKKRSQGSGSGGGGTCSGQGLRLRYGPDCLRVEEVALDEYRKKGWTGVESEWRLPRMIYYLMMFEILFDTLEPYGHYSAIQGHPIDIECPFFADRRGPRLQLRLREIEAMTDGELAADVGARFDDLRSVPPVGDTSMNGPHCCTREVVVTVCRAFGGNRLARFLLQLGRSGFLRCMRGLPDLILWRPSSDRGPRRATREHWTKAAAGGVEAAAEPDGGSYGGRRGDGAGGDRSGHGRTADGGSGGCGGAGCGSGGRGDGGGKRPQQGLPDVEGEAGRYCSDKRPRTGSGTAATGVAAAAAAAALGGCYGTAAAAAANTAAADMHFPFDLLFVEVKSAKDTVRWDQEAWFEWLESVGVQAELCRVVSEAAES